EPRKQGIELPRTVLAQRFEPRDEPGRIAGRLAGARRHQGATGGEEIVLEETPLGLEREQLGQWIAREVGLQPELVEDLQLAMQVSVAIHRHSPKPFEAEPSSAIASRIDEGPLACVCTPRCAPVRLTTAHVRRCMEEELHRRMADDASRAGKRYSTP